MNRKLWGGSNFGTGCRLRISFFSRVVEFLHKPESFITLFWHLVTFQGKEIWGPLDRGQIDLTMAEFRPQSLDGSSLRFRELPNLRIFTVIFSVSISVATKTEKSWLEKKNEKWNQSGKKLKNLVQKVHEIRSSSHSGQSFISPSQNGRQIGRKTHLRRFWNRFTPF